MKDLIITANYNAFLNLLIQQYKDKNNFSAILKAVANQCNNLETAFFELRDEFNIENGAGIQLDIIGKVVGLDRAGRDDESYKTLLKIKAEINFSSGTPEAIIKTAQKLYNATEVELSFIYPAKVQLWQNGDIGIILDFNMQLDDSGFLELDDGEILIVNQPDDIAEDLIFQVLPAGVGLILANNFVLDDNGFLELDDGNIMIVT